MDGYREASPAVGGRIEAPPRVSHHAPAAAATGANETGGYAYPGGRRNPPMSSPSWRATSIVV